MSKIRINELARELEVPSHVILELLPDLGVTDKKTHSSSVEDDIADRVRKRLSGAEEREELVPEEPAVPEEQPEVSAEAQKARPAAKKPSVREATAEVPSPAQAVQTAEQPVLPAVPNWTARTASQPIRPPLAGQQGAPTPPLQPPLRPAQTSAPPPTPPAQPAAIPAKPVPPPRPGQILTGPRQPLPPGFAAEPPKVVPPGRPIPAPPQARTPLPKQAAAKAEQKTPAEAAPLAGRPAARPVVPPRPDMVAKLKPQGKAAPGQPMPARPGMPARTPTPVPGQPIYRGPIRPGQPLVRGPGAPGPRGPGRGRGPHPTAVPLPEPPKTDAQRRTHGKPAKLARDRERDREGKLLPFAGRRPEPAPLPVVDKEITISAGVTVKELAEKLGLKGNQVLQVLVNRGVFVTINQALDAKLAEDVARRLGAGVTKMSYEEEQEREIEQAEETGVQVERAPVVTIMGHVDHGKTSLLDAIRLTNVAEREAGGITQHIGAYQVEQDGRKIVFIDTPGHEAFTRMRARGAKVTDIVILVVAADDGVMPQTLEAMDHAKAAQVPIIVAINKIDKPDAQPERIKQQLADRGLLPEDWGGDTITVPVSAKAKTNLDLLLEMVLTVAEMQELKAAPSRPAVGTILEAKLDKGRGPVATLLVRNGTLRVGDYFICGSVFGKVRALFSDRGVNVDVAEPSTPVEVVGLDSLPDVGDSFQVTTDTAKAKQIVLYRESKAREQAMMKSSRVTLDRLHEQLSEGGTKELNIILKTDVGGTAEVLTDTLQKLSTEKVSIRVLHSGVGAITETDVLLASASNAVIVGFNVRPDRNAANLAEQDKVDVRLHTIIYELTDEIKRAMVGMLEPVFKEVYRGRAEVREVFRISKVGTVAGCYVQDGYITRDSQVRLLRDNVVVHQGRIDSLKRFKNDASEVKSGFECGVGLANYNDIKPGDVIEAFVTERVAAESLV